MNSFMDKVKRNSIINPETGELSYTYKYKNEHCITSVIDSRIAKQYVGYDLIKHDLGCAKDWITHAYELLPHREDLKHVQSENKFLPIEDNKTHSLIMALFISSITYYGKCFTQADGRGIKLDKVFVPEDYHGTHEKIMKFRHTLAAHSGEGDWDTGHLKLISSPKKRKNHSPFILSEYKVLNFFDDSEDEDSYINLINKLELKVTNKMNKLSELIFKEINTN